jgi:SAM-dependent methyltransferase
MKYMINGSDVERDWISCNACGADAFEQILETDKGTVGRCLVCSLIYVNPVPFFKQSNYHDIAKVSYYTKFQREITTDKVEFKRRQLRSQFEEISAVAPRSDQHTSFLDIGCGPGLAVRAAVDLGWEAVGIDIDSELVGLGKHQLGVDLRCSNLIESRFNDGQFDFIQFMSVLHLLPNPFDVLIEVKRVLALGGAVSIVVPNQDGLLNQLNLLVGRKRQNRFGTLVFPYHLYAFTPATLERLLVRSGLKLHMRKTATPVDPRYAIIDQLKQGDVRRTPLKLAWRFAEIIGQGSVLVAYAGKQKL